MNSSHLPPGCSSADGGIDHAYEAAIETLCDNIDTPELAYALVMFIPIIEKMLDESYKEGWKEGFSVGEMKSHPDNG